MKNEQEKWIVSLETVVRLPYSTVLGYTVVSDAEPFDSFPEASAFIRANNLPLGWVAARVTQSPWCNFLPPTPEEKQDITCKDATVSARALPHPASPEVSAKLDSILAEYHWPTNTKNAARAGWEAANRWLTNAAFASPTVSAPKLSDNQIRAAIEAEKRFATYFRFDGDGQFGMHHEASSADTRAYAHFTEQQVISILKALGVHGETTIETTGENS